DIELCGERVPVENQEVRERFEKELLLSLWDRPQVILWLKRSRRYMPTIEQMLKENGLPEDLKYVAVAESALRPHVRSGRGARGFWQFMAGTGKKYGLVINRRIDERRNLFASSRAAIQYFKDLHKTFGSWTLAIAAFNMGEEGLMTEMMEQDTDNYYALYLPLETQRFVFRILSVKMIFSDPARYGFRLNEEDYYPPLTFDRVEVTCEREMPIQVIAKAAGTHFKVIKDLNPEIRGHYLAKGSHNILVPKGASEGFEARYESAAKDHLTNKKEQIYVVKEGDNLSSIADRFDVPLTSIIIWNRINPRRHIHPGQRLIIYPNNMKSKKVDAQTRKGEPGTQTPSKEE
ncbi:MAG: transglycosylase SLT domain-containing protein, partial [Desulfobacteraceae bacterium]